MTFFKPVTPQAKTFLKSMDFIWVDDNEGVSPLGSRPVACEHRFVTEFARSLKHDGFIVKPEGDRK